MEQALRKFQEVMKAEFRSEDTHFLERQGRLLFLCFMKPIINGRGNYYVEPETRDNTRLLKGLDMKYRYNYFCAITRDKIMAMIFVKNSMTSVGSAAIS